jgi:hypothetical protein
MRLLALPYLLPIHANHITASHLLFVVVVVVVVVTMGSSWHQDLCSPGVHRPQPFLNPGGRGGGCAASAVCLDAAADVPGLQAGG